MATSAIGWLPKGEFIFSEQAADLGSLLLKESGYFFGILNSINKIEGYSLGESIPRIYSHILVTQSFLAEFGLAQKIKKILIDDGKLLFMAWYVEAYLKNQPEIQAQMWAALVEPIKKKEPTPPKAEQVSSSKTARVFSDYMKDLRGQLYFISLIAAISGFSLSFTSLSLALKFLGCSALLIAFILEHRERNAFLEKLKVGDASLKIQQIKNNSRLMDTHFSPAGKKLINEKLEKIYHTSQRSIFEIKGTVDFITEVTDDVKHKHTVELVKGIFISLAFFTACLISVGVLVINPASYVLTVQQVLTATAFASMMVNTLYDNYMKNYYAEEEGNSEEQSEAV